MTDGECQRLHVGDHVSDREDPDATMLVVGTPVETAAEYVVDGSEAEGTAATVADYNGDYPDDDAVVEVVFPCRTDIGVPSQQYAYPRSRLALETPIHDTEAEGSRDELAASEETA